MKALTCGPCVDAADSSPRPLLWLGLLLALGAGWGLRADDGPAAPAAETTIVAVTDTSPSVVVVSARETGPADVATNRSPARAFSPLVEGVIKMADAGISPSVIQTYVESSLETEPLNEEEVIALKEHNVPDDVVTLLLKRGAERRDLKQQRTNEAIARAVAARRSVTGGLDPESYEYFQRYYLQPRAAASAQRRLAPWSGPRRFHPYGAAPGPGSRHYGGGRGPRR